MTRRSLVPALAAVAAVAAVVAVGSLAGRGEAPQPDRLLVHDTGGRIVTMRSDGAERTELAGPAAAGRAHVQPTFSADGDLVAWAEIGTGPSRLVVAGADGSARRSVEVPVPPFYLSWSPTGGSVAGLGNGDAGIGAFAVRVDDLAVTSIGEGQPFYFDWGPGGDRLLAHIGVDLLVEVDVASGERSPLEGIVPGGFRAPAWLADGRRFYAVRGTVRHALVVEDSEGRRDRAVDFDGLVAFDAAGGRVAYRAAGGDSGGAVTAATAQPVPAPRGVLAVLDLRSRVQAVVSPDEVLGFEWSPDGSRLLFLTASGDDRPQRMRWNVWSGTEITPFEPFVPTALYVRDYLPFFDQYARSQTVWAPDGNAFAYAGTSEDGRSGIWVQRLGSASPAYLGPGEMVSWGP